MGEKQDRRAFLKMGVTHGTGLVIGCLSLSGCANPAKTDTTAKKERKMDEMIAYCGLRCDTCSILLATREENDKKRAKMRAEIAQVIKEQYGVEHKPEDITDCDGCKTEGGRLFSGCSKCQVRKCAREKDVENCAHCDKYVCEKLKEFFVKEPDAKE